MGESGRVLAGGVWAAWLRLCEAVCGCLRRGSAFGRAGDEVFRDVNAGLVPGLLRRPIGGGLMVGVVSRGF